MAESVEQLDPTQQLSIETVKERAIKGAFILTFRTAFLQVIAFVSVALLTVFLEPKEFGVFFIVSSVINFLAYFSDIGFAAALIQKKDKLGNVELKTIFTVQQIMVVSLLLIVLLATPLIQNIYQFPNEAIFLLWALALSLLFSSLKTIPSVLLERRLDFNKLVIPQIVETTLFNIVAVYLASKGFGVTSFTWAVLIRGISGLLIMYVVQPWVPGFAFSKDSLKSLLKFGIPYQGNTFLAMIKDDGITLLLGGILGSSGLGLLAWAQKWAFSPLRFFMDQVIKVTFPAFSRLQGNRQELSKALSKSIFFICLLVFPSLVFLLMVAPSLIEIIPKYNKWSSALLALTLLSVTSALAAITTPLTNTFNAIGKISLTFKLMVMWTSLTWLFVPSLAFFFGVNGAAFGFSLVGLSSVVAMILALKYIELNFLEIIGKPLLVALLVGGGGFLVRNVLPPSLVQIVLMSIVGFVTFSATALILEPKLLDFFKKR